MSERFPLGSVARLYLDIIDVDLGVVSQSPTLALRRVADNKWFQASDSTWQTNIVENAMTQTDVTNLPGRYHFDFDQTKDALARSTVYTIKLVNGGEDSRLEYRDLCFGPMAATVVMTLCSVQGTVSSAQGEPVGNAAVKASLLPVYNGGSGRAVESIRTLICYTQPDGSFDLPLVRGGVFRLEIDSVGYDRKITVPNQASVLFTDL